MKVGDKIKTTSARKEKEMQGEGPEDTRQILTRRQFAGLVIAAGVVSTSTILLGGCSNNATDAKAIETDKQVDAPQEKIVIDAKKNEFTIPDKVDRIAITCNGGTTHEVAIFGGADKIVAQPPMKAFPQLLKMYPRFKDVINAGSFDDLNIEALIAQEPDIALVGIKSDKGNAQIVDIGIPIYVMLIGWAAIDTLKQEFLNVGQILGNEQKAQELVDYWDEKLNALNSHVAKVPQAERKKVYYLSAADITKASNGDWGRTWIEQIGAEFAVPEADLNGDVTVEQVMKWNPDVIVVQGGNDLNELYSNAQIQDLKAIKNKQIFSCPIGGFWWDRPSPEATLGFQWLAKMVYPDYMEDVDIEQETKYFFKQFYGHDLSAEEFLSF